MAVFNFKKNRVTIDDRLIERKDGTLYDTYYDSIEKWGDAYIVQYISKILSKQFIGTTDDLSLLGFYFVEKPGDMPFFTYQMTLRKAIQICINGPSVKLIEEFLNIFSPNSQLILYKNPPIYKLDTTTTPPAGFAGSYEYSLYNESSSDEQITIFKINNYLSQQYPQLLVLDSEYILYYVENYFTPYIDFVEKMLKLLLPAHVIVSLSPIVEEFSISSPYVLIDSEQTDTYLYTEE